MANEVIGIDWAAGGLKLAVRCLDQVAYQQLWWSSDVAEAPPLGDADPLPLAAFVKDHHLTGRPARVALQRRDVLMVSCRQGDVAASIESILPPPLTRWRWTCLPFDGGADLVVAVEASRVLALEKFLRAAGLRFASLAFVVDPHGGGAVTIDIGLNEAQVASRAPGGPLRVRRARREANDIVAAVGRAPVTTVHFTGGGAFDGTLVAELKERLSCEMILPSSPEDAMFRSAVVVAAGGGISLCDGARPVLARPRAWARGVGALALSLVFGSSAAVGRAERVFKERQRSIERAHRDAPTDIVASAVLARALAAIPPAVTLTDLDLNAGTREMTFDGAAGSQESVSLLVEGLAQARFIRARCVKTAVDESRRVKFSVVAGYDR